MYIKDNVYKLEFLKTVIWSKFLYKKKNIRKYWFKCHKWGVCNKLKFEIESNFLTTTIEEPTLNHWVHTILNQLVIQFEPSQIKKKMVT